MAEDFWQRDDGDDNQEYGGDGNEIVWKDKSLLRRVSGLRTWWLRLRLGRREVGLSELQLGHRDRRNCREWNGQRRDGWLRNRLCHSSGGLGRDRIEARGDFGNGPASSGFVAEGVPRDIQEGLGERIGDGGVGLASGLQDGCVLRERFHQGNAERPDVRGCREWRSSGLGSVVSIEFARQFSGFTDGEKRVAGKLELIGGGENVGGLDPRMNEANAVKINKCIKHGLQHLANFRIHERALGENLGEVFFGILHYDEETVQVLEAAAADFEDAQQMGMS